MGREARGASSALQLNASDVPRPYPSRRSRLAPRASRRRGISLLEVLIAMFVMLFGLMGVAAIMPVGNHYAARSDQYDRGAALAGSAFAEIKTRGLLRPGIWMHPSNVMVMNDVVGNPLYGTFANNDPGHAFVLDPIGAAGGSGDVNANLFPYGGWQAAGNPGWTLTPTTAQWPLRRVSFAAFAGGVAPAEIAEAVMRLHDDLSAELPDRNDQPGIQIWETDDINGTPDYPADDTLITRAYAGSYSWLATVLPVNAEALAGMQPSSPRHGSFLYEVSVAVFRKREDEPSVTSERLLQAELGPGGDLVVYAASDVDVDDASQDIRAGNWIALAGVHPTNGKFLLKWYRLLSYDDETDVQQLYSGGSQSGRRAMVEGAEWPANTPTANPLYSTNLRAILLPNIIGVATQTVKLETN
jgi:hypothetical protein